MYSDSGDHTGELVFAGWGIHAPELGYDDYAGLDVKGKFVLCFRGTPDPADKRFTQHDEHRTRMAVARDRGALGLVYIYDEVQANPNGDWLAGFTPAEISFPAADRILALKSTTAQALQDDLKKYKRPLSFTLDAQLRFQVQSRYFPDATGYNVAGYVEGSRPAVEERDHRPGRPLRPLRRPPRLHLPRRQRQRQRQRRGHGAGPRDGRPAGQAQAHPGLRAVRQRGEGPAGLPGLRRPPALRLREGRGHAQLRHGGRGRRRLVRLQRRAGLAAGGDPGGRRRQQGPARLPPHPQRGRAQQRLRAVLPEGDPGGRASPATARTSSTTSRRTASTGSTRPSWATSARWPSASPSPSPTSN